MSPWGKLSSLRPGLARPELSSKTYTCMHSPLPPPKARDLPSPSECTKQTRFIITNHLGLLVRMATPTALIDFKSVAWELDCLYLHVHGTLLTRGCVRQAGKGPKALPVMYHICTTFVPQQERHEIYTSYSTIIIMVSGLHMLHVHAVEWGYALWYNKVLQLCW